MAKNKIRVATAKGIGIKERGVGSFRTSTRDVKKALKIKENAGR